MIAAGLDRSILKGAVVGGAINAVINGGIQFWLLKDHAPVALSVDGIGNDVHTVFGAAVPLAVSLAMILTVIGHLTLKGPKRPFWPEMAWLTLRHGIFTFGLLVTLAVIWQRAMGSVTVSLTAAVLILAVVAGLVAGIVNYMTLRTSRVAKSGDEP